MGSANIKLSRRQVLGIAAGGVVGAAGFRYLTLQLPGGAQQVASAAGPAGAWASPLTGASGRAAHLLRRATFGYTAAELAQAASMSYPDLVDMVINQSAQPLPAVANPTSYQEVVRAWYQHMATTPAQFPERMTLFWHGLLTSDYRKAARLPFVLQQNELYRTAGRSDFRTLINAVTYDPLMIRYLDLEESTAAAPNENYSRELMELFTLGVGNYTETDVREGARAFSGIRTVLVDATGTRMQPPKLKGSTPSAYAQALEQLLSQGATFKGVLARAQHDGGSKTFLGHTGNLNPAQALDIILEQPSCAPHIARNALVQFCTPNPPASLIDSVATAFRTSNYDIKTLMRSIFTSEAFTSAGGVSVTGARPRRVHGRDHARARQAGSRANLRAVGRGHGSGPLRHADGRGLAFQPGVGLIGIMAGAPQLRERGRGHPGNLPRSGGCDTRAARRCRGAGHRRRLQR